MGAIQRVTRRRRVIFVCVSAMLAMLMLPLMATASGAVTGYSVAGNGGSLHERSTPSTSAAIVGTLPDHTPLDIACQTTGDNVDGSSIWDRLGGSSSGNYVSGSYVSDYWTTTPVVGAFSPGIPQCSTTPPAPVPAGNVYHVLIHNASLHERSGPNTSSAIVGTLNNGATVTITCQTYGEDIQGSTIWDRLGNGAYVTDFYITTPLYGQFSPGLAQCAGTTTPAPSSREQQAIAWAENVLHSSDPSWDYDDHRPWSGYCETFVERAFGTIGQFGSALKQYNWQKGQGRIHTDTNPPAGAEVFYGGGQGFGHVALSIGGGQVITTWGFVGNRDKVRTYGVAQFSNPYYGWAAAPPSWPGR